MARRETTNQRLARLFDLPIGTVEEDNDPAWLAVIAPRRPAALAYTLDALERLQDPPWILAGWVPSGLTAIYSRPKGGKTFWVMTLAICYAMGIPFFDLPVAGSGKVLYIAAEGSGKANWRRIERIAKVMKVDMEKLRERLVVVTTGVKVDNPDNVEDFLTLNPGTWDLIVVDTLARCMDGDENQTADMNLAVEGMSVIRRRTKAHGLIVIHHQGHKGDRMRGAIALFGAVDAQLHTVRSADGIVQVKVEELREAAVSDDNVRTYRLDKEVGALVSIPTVSAPQKLDEREQKMWDVLKQQGPLAFADWMAALDALSPDLLAPSPGRKPLSKSGRRSQWRRSVERMMKLGTVDMVEGKYKAHIPSDDFKEDDERDFGPGG